MCSHLVTNTLSIARVATAGWINCCRCSFTAPALQTQTPTASLAAPRGCTSAAAAGQWQVPGWQCLTAAASSAPGFGLQYAQGETVAAAGQIRLSSLVTTGHCMATPGFQGWGLGGLGLHLVTNTLPIVCIVCIVCIVYGYTVKSALH